MPRMTHAQSITEGERILAQDQSKFTFERVTGQPNPKPPLSIRLSSALLERLDAIATAQHRKRAGLIQHILWEYVQAHDLMLAREPEAPAPKADAARANAKKGARPRRGAAKR